MKSIVMFLFGLFSLCSLAIAAPFAVVHVPSAAADRCMVAFPSTAPAVEMVVVVNAAYGRPANANRVCLVDVATALVGDTTMTAALKSDLWGVMGSPIPFTFPRPSPESLVPESIELKK